MSKKKDNAPNARIQRLALWSEQLSTPDSVTDKQMQEIIYKKTGELKLDLRKDISFIINELLPNSGVELISTKKGRCCYRRLSSPVDLVKLYYQKKAGRPNADMLDLITRTQGIFPEDFLSEISSTYKEIVEQQNRNEYVISFENKSTPEHQLRFFSVVYHAINKQGLLITRHKANSPDTKEQVILYPEFLKQYNSEWHVYGVIEGPNDTDKGNECSRVPLALIDDIDNTYKSKKFIASDTDYMDLFDEIVGVEMDPNCTLEDVHLYVSYELYPIIKRNPLHSSQKDDKDAKRKSGYKAVKINVRKNKELIRKLVSYGKDIIVDSPTKLRNQVKKELQKALEQY